MDTTGETVARASSPTPWDTGGGWIEVGVAALLESVRAAMAGLGATLSGVAGVGVAGMAESGAALDGAGRPLSPVIAWNDPRGQDVVARVEARLKPAIDPDGLARSIGRRLTTVSTVAKLGWLVAEGAGPVEQWLGVPELVVHALSGVAVTEHSLAARSGCYDVGRLEWLPAVAEAAGFAVGAFPPVMAAGTAMASVSAAGSAWSGIPAGAALTIAGHDHLAGVLGAGLGPADLANSVGTAETVVGLATELPDVAAALAGRVAITVFPGARTWAAMASAARAGVVLATAAAALGHPPAILDHMAEGADSWLDLDHSVVDALAGGDASALAGAVTGASTMAEAWGGLLRALSARTAQAALRVSPFALRPERVVAFGGGVVSRPWMAAKAASLHLPLWLSPAVDAPARGAAVAGGVAIGWWDDVSSAPRPCPELFSAAAMSRASRATLPVEGP